MKKVFKWVIFLLVSLATVFVLSPEAEASTDDMYRLYNPNSGEHFYTKNGVERDMLKGVGWKDEGIGWYAPTKGDPVYRLYNPNAGDHHYTLNGNEKDMLVKVGWRYEGVGWYSDTKKTIKLYRAYNPNAKAGSHNYTVNGAEQEMLIKTGWKDEGLAWYGAHRGSGDEKPVPSVKKTDLQNLYNKYKGMTKGTYTSATWDAFQSALKNAKSTIDDKKATQKQVDDAKSNLQKAFNGLKKESIPAPSVNKKDLQTLYDKYKGTAKDSYTTATWDNFQTALKSAKSVLDNVKATQAQVNTAKDTLQNSYTGLKKETQQYTITIKYVDTEQKEIKTADTVQVKQGEKYTATAPKIEGYEVQGEETKTTDVVSSDQTLKFTYKKVEKVAVTGRAYSFDNQLLKNSEITVSFDNQVIETLSTDDEGYFYTHLILKKTYTLNGKDFEATVVANGLNDFATQVNKGNIFLGREIVKDGGVSSLKPSVVYLTDEESSLSKVDEGFSEVVFDGEVELQKDDVFVTPPSEQYPSGVALKVTEVISTSGETILKTEQPKLEEVIDSLEGEASIGLDQATFIPAEGVTIENPPQQAKAFGIEGNIEENLETQISLGKQIKNGSIEMAGFMDFGGKIDIDAAAGWELSGFYTKFDVKATLSQRVHGNINITGSYDSKEELRLGEIVVPTPIPTITVNIPVYLLVNVNGEATLTFDASVIESAGIRKVKESNDIQVYPEMKDMIKVPAPKFSFEGSFDAKLGIQASVSANVLQMDIAKINGRTGLGYSCQASLSSGSETNSFNQKISAFGSVDAEVPFIGWKQDIFPQKEWVLWEKNIEEPKGEGTGQESGGETPGGENPGEESEGWLPLTEVNFPDEHFRNNLHPGLDNLIRYKYDSEGNFMYREIQADKVSTLSLGETLTRDITGIEKFKNLTQISFRRNYNLEKVDLTKNKNLQSVWMNWGSLEQINLKGLNDVKDIMLHENNLKTLDVSNLPNLMSLDCSNNKLESLNYENSTDLMYMNVNYNQLEYLPLEKLINLRTLNCDENRIKELDFTNNRGLPYTFYHDCTFKNNPISKMTIPDDLTNMIKDDNGVKWLDFSNLNYNLENKITVFAPDKTGTFNWDGSRYCLTEY